MYICILFLISKEEDLINYLLFKKRARDWQWLPSCTFSSNRYFLKKYLLWCQLISFLILELKINPKHYLSSYAPPECRGLSSGPGAYWVSTYHRVCLSPICI